MLRALVVALLLANLALFGWTRGWLDDVVGVRARGDREPERLARQVRPESVRILPASAANETAPEALACLEAGPFSDAEFVAARAAVQGAVPSGAWAEVKVDLPGTWIVYMGKYADRSGLVKKEDELKRRNVAYEEVTGTAALAPGLSLGRFDDKVAAEEALAQFTQQGIRTARVVQTLAPRPSHHLRVEKADSALAARLTALATDALGKGFVACNGAPKN